MQKYKGKMEGPLSSNGALEKEQFGESLGTEKVVAVGNGVNDSLMLKKAALGIIVIGEEGAASCIKQRRYNSQGYS